MKNRLTLGRILIIQPLAILMYSASASTTIIKPQGPQLLGIPLNRDEPEVPGKIRDSEAGRTTASLINSAGCTPSGNNNSQYVTIFGKINHLRASTEIHFLPVHESYIHALSGNTKCLTIDGQVCFYRRPFADAVEPRGCISWP